jgi:hypothetical protein
MCEDKIIATSPKWKDVFSHKALLIKASGKMNLGFKIMWYLWSADIWFDNFPLLKFIILANVVVWIIMWWTK